MYFPDATKSLSSIQGEILTLFLNMIVLYQIETSGCILLLIGCEMKCDHEIHGQTH
jgi:hypothetical protein